MKKLALIAIFFSFAAHADIDFNTPLEFDLKTPNTCVIKTASWFAGDQAPKFQRDDVVVQATNKVMPLPLTDIMGLTLDDNGQITAARVVLKVKKASGGLEALSGYGSMKLLSKGGDAIQKFVMLQSDSDMASGGLTFMIITSRAVTKDKVFIHLYDMAHGGSHFSTEFECTAVPAPSAAPSASNSST